MKPHASTLLLAAIAVLIWSWIFYMQQRAYEEFQQPKTMWDASQGPRPGG